MRSPLRGRDGNDPALEPCRHRAVRLRARGGAVRVSKPADLPVEQPTKFEVVINLNTAKAFGPSFPPGWSPLPALRAQAG